MYSLVIIYYSSQERPTPTPVDTRPTPVPTRPAAPSFSKQHNIDLLASSSEEDEDTLPKTFTRKTLAEEAP